MFCEHLWRRHRRGALQATGVQACTDKLRELPDSAGGGRNLPVGSGAKFGLTRLVILQQEAQLERIRASGRHPGRQRVQEVVLLSFTKFG